VQKYCRKVYSSAGGKSTSQTTDDRQQTTYGICDDIKSESNFV